MTVLLTIYVSSLALMSLHLVPSSAQVVVSYLYSRLKTENMEADITNLRNKLKECEDERLKAAQYGLQLLERQRELQSQLDKCHEEMMTTAEVGSVHLFTRKCLGPKNLCGNSILFFFFLPTLAALKRGRTK